MHKNTLVLTNFLNKFLEIMSKEKILKIIFYQKRLLGWKIKVSCKWIPNKTSEDVSKIKKFFSRDAQFRGFVSFNGSSSWKSKTLTKEILNVKGPFFKKGNFDDFLSKHCPK